MKLCTKFVPAKPFYEPEIEAKFHLDCSSTFASFWSFAICACTLRASWCKSSTAWSSCAGGLLFISEAAELQNNDRLPSANVRQIREGAENVDDMSQ
jgi:hypothetical protein